MQSTQVTPSVNIKFAKCLLFIGNDGIPYIRDQSGVVTQLENNDLGRWTARAFYQPVEATPQAKQWYKSSDPMDLEEIKGLVHKPHWYQVLAIYRMQISNCALWFDMGLGKTLTSFGLALLLYQRHNCNRFLILCPPTVFATWKEEFHKHIDPSIGAQIVFAHGARKQKVLTDLKLNPSNRPAFIVTTYESLRNVIAHLQFINLHAIFLDESSKIKNPTALRTQAVFKLRNMHPNAKRYVMSGTPSMTKPTGFYLQYEFLGQGFSEFNTFSQFKNHYVNSIDLFRCQLPNGEFKNIRNGENKDGEDYRVVWLKKHSPTENGPSYFDLGYHFNFKYRKNSKTITIHNAFTMDLGTKNIPRLAALTRKLAYPLYKKDVFVDLPEKFYQTREIELSPKAKKLYKEICETNRTELASKPLRFDGGTPHQKLHELVNGFLRKDGRLHLFAKNQKISEVESILEECPNEKVVVWSCYPLQIEELSKVLTKKNVSNTILHGGIPNPKRITRVEQFKTPDGPRVLIANPAVAGMGLNLTNSSIQIFICNWWIPELRSQAEDRLHRQGQTNNVMVYDLVTKGTLEVTILKNIRRNIDIQKHIFSPEELKGAE